MIIIRIFKIVARVIEILIILGLILYPILVLKENPFTYYWNMFKELWSIIKSWPILNKIIGLIGRFVSIF